jgi:hypothetical protein
MYSQLSPNRNGSTNTGVNSNPSRSEQAESAAGEGANASKSSSSPPSAPEAPNTATATASSATNSSPSSSQPSTHLNNETLGRRGDAELPATSTNWNRVIGYRVSPATELNTYLPDNESISSKIFWKIVADWYWDHHNSSSRSEEDVVTQQVAALWDQGHLLAIGSSENSGGYGSHGGTACKKRMRAAGRNVLESQLPAQQRTFQPSMPPPHSTQPVNLSVICLALSASDPATRATAASTVGRSFFQAGFVESSDSAAAASTAYRFLAYFVNREC